MSRLRSDQIGAVAIIVALMAPVLVGAMGLGSEAGYWYLTQRRVQNAADTAAHAAAKRKKAGDSTTALQTTAEYIVGLADGTEDAAVALNTPPASGGFTGNGQAIEVIVTETLPRLFTALYTTEPLSIGGRAVGLYETDGTGCVLALSETAQGAITISGSSESTLTLCDMVSNAAGVAFEMVGQGSSVSANCITTVGVAVTTDNLTVNCDTLREYSNPVADPFADVEEPALTGACESGDVGQNNQVTSVTPTESHASGMPSRRYCNGLNVRGTTHFAPGLYLVEGGDFIINSNATLTGDGVVFYLAPDVELRFNGTANMDFSAPDAGPFAGMIIFTSRESTVSHTINGNLGSRLDGAIYAANAHLTLSGSATTSANSCTQIVTGTVEFTGSGEIDINCNNPAGANIDIIGRVMLVE
jgi:hypothetical protein